MRYAVAGRGSPNTASAQDCGRLSRHIPTSRTFHVGKCLVGTVVADGVPADRETAVVVVLSRERVPATGFHRPGPAPPERGSRCGRLVAQSCRCSVGWPPLGCEPPGTESTLSMCGHHRRSARAWSGSGCRDCGCAIGAENQSVVYSPLSFFPYGETRQCLRVNFLSTLQVHCRRCCARLSHPNPTGAPIF